ncbi:MAG: hypothetical protein K0R76_329 [Alphaproteobacteria bacterium]|nr:hypothetical protein [Alphaproteobacteria bacterium]
MIHSLMVLHKGNNGCWCEAPRLHGGKLRPVGIVPLISSRLPRRSAPRNDGMYKEFKGINRHCEEREARRGNLEGTKNTEIAKASKRLRARGLAMTGEIKE